MADLAQLETTITYGEIDRIHNEAFWLGYAAGDKNGYSNGLFDARIRLDTPRLESLDKIIKEEKEWNAKN